MSRTVKLTIIAVVGVLAMGLAFAAGTVISTQSASAQSAVDGLFKGGRGGPGMPGGVRGENQDQYLADALGISLEDLQAAYTTAQDAALQQAVEQGLMTQAQADAIKERADGKGFGFGHGFGGPDGRNSGIDFNALLADALNVSVDELQAAREQAQQAAIDAAVASGELTQEQADNMKAMQALRSYIDREALQAQVLGMSVDELKAAREAGKTMADLLEEKDMTQAVYDEAFTAAYKTAVAQAVTDGVITQAQADEILSKDVPMMGGPGDFGRGGPGGRGGPMGAPGCNCQCSPDAPATTPAPTDGTNSNGA